MRADPGLRELRAAAVTMAAVLASFGSALLLARAAHLDAAVAIQAVVIALTLARSQREADLRDRALGLVLLPAIAVAAAALGSLLAYAPGFGAALFVAVICASIWVRRFGARATKAGTLAVLPVIAILVIPAAPGGTRAIPWAALVALIAWAWVFALQVGAARIGFTEPVRPRAEPEPAPARPPRKAGSTRLLPSTRMALQMGVALAAAFVVARLAFPAHWTWVVLTAFIVCSGARNRGDVAHKAVLRGLGAGLGTAVATVAAGAFGAHRPESVVAIFAVLAVGTWLRALSYAYWAACMTAVLALLYGYFGETAPALLGIRLAAIAAGALAGVAASWWVLPIKTRDVVRRRIADALAALGDVLRAQRSDPAALEPRQARFARSAARLAEIARPLEAHRALVRRRRTGPHLADAIDAVGRCAEPVRTIVRCSHGAEPEPDVARLSAAVSANIAAVRRTIGRQPGSAYQPVIARERAPAPLAASIALAEIDAALATLASVFGAHSPAAPPAEHAPPFHPSRRPRSPARSRSTDMHTADDVTTRARDLLARIAARDGELHCYVAVDEAAVLREAARLDALPAGARGPLHGRALGVKDMIDVAGLPTRAGSSFFRRDPERDAPAVAALRAAGALVVGKTNTHEFAWGITTVNPHFGRTANPWDESRIAGGSSGGSAAAVAAGLADIALGGDTLGSIRIPAALTGLSGLRPATGTVSLEGAVPLALGLDTIGPIAPDLATVQQLYETLAGRPLAARGPRRVCRLRGGVWEAVEPCVLSALDAAAAALRADGIAVDDVAWSDDALADAVMTIMAYAAQPMHAPLFAAHAERYGNDLRPRVAGALAVSAQDERDARAVVARARASWDAATAGYAVALVPAVGCEAPQVPVPPTFRDHTIPLTAPVSVFGFPSASAPVGFGPAGLPLGMGIVALDGEAASALAVGRRFQELTGWHRRRAPLAGANGGAV